MTIYLDLVFIENVCMNSIILFTTGIVTKTKNHIIRNLLSSTLGALYAVGKYFYNKNIYNNFFIQIIIALAIVYIAFMPKSLKWLFKYLIVFYLTSFVFGGCAFALLYYIKPQEILYNNGFLTGTYPIKIAFLGAIIRTDIFEFSFQINKK